VAVPKGPSLDPSDKRLAMMVEDHPVSYFDFEGIIPPGNYGAGTVQVWDVGTWEPLDDPHQMMTKGDFKFRLKGKKLKVNLCWRGCARGAPEARVRNGC